MPAAKLGMWLFLTSEAMFFIGLLGSFIVLESAGSQHQLFADSARVLFKSLGFAEVILLACSSVALRAPGAVFKWIAVVVTIVFLLLQVLQWELLLHHKTMVLWNSGTRQIVDGYPVRDANLLNPRMMNAPDQFDLHAITPADFPSQLTSPSGTLVLKDPDQVLNYGPSRNNFFAIYFLTSTAHVLHLLVGVIAVLWFMLFAKGRLPDAVQIYWHFVNAVGVIAFLALYFV